MTDNTEAQENNNDWAAQRLAPPRPKPVGLMKAAGMGLMRGGVKVAKGLTMAAAPFLPSEDAHNEGIRTRESLFRFIDTVLTPAEKFWTPDPGSVGTAGQVVGALSELPLQLVGGPTTMINTAAMNTGVDLVEQGVGSGTATAAAIGAGAVNALMIKLPQAGRNWKETLGLIGLNPLMGAGQDLALKKGLESQGYQEQADAIDPLNPAARSVDLLLGGVFGALGYHAERVNAKARATSLESVAKRAEEYHDLITRAGGEQAIREQLPVEVVDSLDTINQHLKILETNPLNRDVLDGVDRHIDMLKTALASVDEGRPVDVTEHVADAVKPVLPSLELQGLMDRWSARYGMTPDEEAGVSSLIQARAKALGMDADELVGKYFADVTSERPAEGATELYQRDDLPQIHAFIDKALTDKRESGVFKLRDVQPREAEDIQRAIDVDVSTYRHEINGRDLRHAINQHGDARIEQRKGQLPVTADDLKRIPEIIDTYDRIEKGSVNAQGRKSVRYVKRVNGTVYYVETVMDRGVLSGKTMWKKPSAGADAVSPDNTSETASGLASSTKDILFQSRFVVQPFYSKLLKEVDALPQEKWNSNDLLNKIRKTQGVKEEEIAWTGLDEFLKGKKSVTRAEVREFLDQNQVQVREVQKGNNSNVKWDVVEDGKDPEYPIAIMRDGVEVQRLKSKEFLQEELEDLQNSGIPRESKTKYERYVTPGGENYRELLLTLPGGEFKGSHFDERGILAHVRFNERRGNDGERILHLEEVQSDWHQARRDGKSVPDAPFAKTWHELALKRMLRYAAEEGYDRLTWTTGEQQAERYDISKKMKSVSYRHEGDQYHLSGVDIHGDEHALGSFGTSQLPDAVGKELSQKITGGEGAPDGHWMKLSGSDLKVGGSGMKGFYDKMLPQYLDKLGRRFGAKVEDVKVATHSKDFNEFAAQHAKMYPEATDADIKSAYERFTQHSTVHSIPITDAMRDSLLFDGQPLFQGEKGAVSFLADGRAVIHALEQPDISTAVHELAHVFAKTLKPEERFHFDRWLQNMQPNNRPWNVEQQERFARGFETYLAEGKAPTPELQTFFDKFKTWLVEIYRNIMGSPLADRLHPEAKKAFDRMLFSEMVKRDVNPETARVQQEAAALVADRDAELHELAGMEHEAGNSDQGSVIRNPEPPTSNLEPQTPNRILRDLALHTYDDPEMIKRFVAEPTNVAGALAQALEIEAGKVEAAGKARRGPSLVEYLRTLGIGDDRGDLASMDVDKGLKPFQKKLLRPEGISLDKARELAVERGYIPEGATTADLLDAVGQELRGTPLHAVSGADAVEAPGWFQSILNLDRRTGKYGDAIKQAAKALRQTAEGRFATLPTRQQDIVLAALDHINYTAQEHAREIDAQDLQVGDRYMTSDMAFHTVTAERDGRLVLDNGQAVPMDGTIRILGEVDQSGRPPEKGYDPLDYQVESLLEERGDFELHNGTDAAGNPIMKSARELVDEAKDALAVSENQKHLYDRAAACMGLEF